MFTALTAFSVFIIFFFCILISSFSLTDQTIESNEQIKKKTNNTDLHQKETQQTKDNSLVMDDPKNVGTSMYDMCCSPFVGSKSVTFDASNLCTFVILL